MVDWSSCGLSGVFVVLLVLVGTDFKKQNKTGCVVVLVSTWFK